VARPKKGTDVTTPIMVVLAVALGFFAMAILPRLLERSHAMVGKPAPTLALPALHGGKAGLDLASLRGKVVVLDFWAPWCQPCKHEMPVLDKLAKKLGPDVVVVGVLVDPDLDGARAVISRLQIGYDQVEDDKRAAARAYSVSVLPTLVVIDKQGTVRSYRTGFSPEEDVEDAIKRAMGS
jgi:thiol-disulfide isomerase/thioredoxin